MNFCRGCLQYIGESDDDDSTPDGEGVNDGQSDANRASKVGVSISKLPGEGVARTGG